MEISQKLKEQGWHLTDDGVKKVIAAASAPGAETSDVRKIIAAAMDMDFRDIAAGALPTKREDSIPGRIVLQVQKVRNISAPKANEESKAAPRFLQLELSDGQNGLQALELEHIPSLSLNVPPGTKIHFRAERLQLMQGFLILRAADMQVLGGRVEALVEKWELARTMLKYARSGRRMSGASGPPPWIPFGKKMETPLANERNFKSLQAGADKDKETKENEEFNAMRNEAIAVASKAGAKKVFGGGGRQILDHNVKKILEKGYSEEDANNALRATNNNLERALYNLKRRQDYNRPEEGSMRGSSTGPIAASKFGGRSAAPREMGGGGKRGIASAREEATAPKPVGNVSLFDFLTDKLPTETANATAATSGNVNSTYSSSSAATRPTATTSASTSRFEKPKSEVTKANYGATSKLPSSDAAAAASSRPRFENNISSSFAANRTSAPRGGRGGSSSGGRGGFGGGASSYTPRDGGNERGGPRSSSSNTNSNYNQSQSSRGNRSSHERSKVPSSGIAQQEGATGSGSGGGGYNSRRANEQQNRGSGERYNSYSDTKGRYNQRDSNNRQANNNSATAPNANNNNGNSSSSTNNSEHAARMNKLTEATSKIKIDKSRGEQSAAARSGGGGGGRHHSQQQQHSQNSTQNYGGQQQQQQEQQQQQNNFTQLPNGFTYDPSKIIGFQNKETNEFAMTLLKSQGQGAAAPPQQQQQQEQQRHAPVPAPAPTHHTSYVPAAVSPMQVPPATSPYATPPAYMLPAPQSVPPTAPIPSHFGMVPGDGWLWKIGDLCLAKYWDDGRYYEAEITAVSDKTCVVFFLGYGNHEEVLKSDCLPITDANNRPINNYSAAQQHNMVPPPPPQSQPPPMQSGSFQRGGGGGGSQRYRGERQMYVPPHKRDN